MAAPEAQNLDPEAIRAALCQLQLGGTDPFVDGEFQGGECRIFKVRSKDCPSLSMRVRHPNQGIHQHAIEIVDMEARIFQALEAQGFSWTPRYRGASLTFNNPIKYPFIVLDWVEGFPLKWNDGYPLQPIRDALLAQMAEIQLSLITCTLENRMGLYENRMLMKFNVWLI